ncbi:MAG: YggS family pyridoxal phosphate-dependent enzyme [Cyanobacteria bacterium SID2]|nr:YggS family pyridoxal phosphate-dependent enzyme [Cyanobacteria bacterium SID2]
MTARFRKKEGSIVPESLSIAERIVAMRQSLPSSVRLVAVSKMQPAEAIRDAYAAGIRDFGESRIQEAIEKQKQLSDLQDITWHFIGHLQTNKVRLVLEHVQWIHSVDRLKLLKEIDRLVKRGSPSPKLCLQVKLREDPNKFGWSVPELLGDLPEIATFDRLDVRGLMTIPPLELTDSETRAVFDELRQLSDRIRREYGSRVEMEQLSMGMSEDYEIASACGATMVRLGRVLFGERPRSFAAGQC